MDHGHESSSNMAGMVQKILYGGNMSVLLPPESVDVSELRQIPDNQEVFAHSFTEQSIIIEILELIPEEDEEAVRSHFEEIGNNNNADQAEVLCVESLPINHINLSESKSAFCLHGQQYVSKFNETSKHTLNLWMGLIRLPQYQSDIIVTFNDPQEESGHHENGDAPKSWTSEQFKECLKSLKLLNADFLQ